MNNTTSINIDNQPTELIKDQPTVKETKKSTPSGFSAWNGNEILNQKNEQILVQQKEIFDLKKELDESKKANESNQKLAELYAGKLNDLTSDIAKKYGVNDFKVSENITNLNFSNFNNLEKSIINIFETSGVKYNKPEVIINNNKKYKIFI